MGRTCRHTTNGGESDTTNGNEDLAWALFLASVRGVRARSDEGSLLASLRDTVHINNLDWEEAKRQIPTRQAKWQRQQLLQLATNGCAKRLVAQHAASGALSRVKTVIDGWVASTIDATGLGCWVCKQGVRVGMECSKCAKVWHFGCLWRQAEEKAHKVALPLNARFAVQGMHRIDCLLCRQGGSLRAPTRGSLLQRFHAYVDGLSVSDAQALTRAQVPWHDSTKTARQRDEGWGNFGWPLPRDSCRGVPRANGD